MANLNGSNRGATCHTIKAGDTIRSLVASLEVDGEPPDLRNARVAFAMRKRSDGAPTIRCGARILDESSGDVEVDWLPGQTSEAGEYDAEFVVTLASGHEVTIPAEGYLTVRILPRL